MFKLHLSIWLFAFLAIVVKGNRGSFTLDIGTKIIAAAFTPFNKNGDINVAGVQKMAEIYTKNKIKAVLVGSYAGEGPSMDLCTRKVLINAWVKAGVPLGLKILVDTVDIPFPDLLNLVRFCAKIEVTAVFVVPVLSYKAKTIEEAIEDLRAVYKVAPKLRLIFHDLKFLTQPAVNSIEVLVAELLKIPTLTGIATSLQTAVEVRRVLGATKDVLIIVIGNSVNAPLALNLGIHLSIWPTLFPRLTSQIAAAVDSGNCRKGADIQLELSALQLCTGRSKGQIASDYTSRSYLQNTKLSYRYMYELNLRQRPPLREVDSVDATKIKTCLAYQGFLKIDTIE